MSSKHSDADYKMFKKIAQLTKVIYHLHTRNEENEEVVKGIKRAYEKEIESIVKDANSIISRQKEAIRVQKDSVDLKAKFTALHEKQELEKKQLQADFNSYKQQVTDKENKMCNEKEETLRKIKAEVISLKGSYECKLESLSKLAKGNESLKKTMEDMKRLHKEEIENHIKENNKKYSDLLQSKFADEDKLKSGHEKEKAEIIAKYEMKIKELLKKAVDDEKGRLETIIEEEVIFYIKMSREKNSKRN